MAAARKSIRRELLKQRREDWQKVAQEGRRRFKVLRVTKAGKTPELSALKTTKTKRPKRARLPEPRRGYIP